MCGVYAVTGHLTGMDRVGIKLQLHKPYIVDISRFPGFTDLKHNLLFTLKTIFIDFCSPFKVAIHTVVNYAYSLSVQEYIIFFLITCMLLSVFLFRKKTAVGHDMAKNKHPYGALTNLLFQLFIIYIFVTIFLWTIGNNDPIYTRFLYPSYLFLMLSVFSYYSYIKNDLTSFYQRIPFYALYLSILLINSYKTLMLSIRTDIIPHW